MRVATYQSPVVRAVSAMQRLAGNAAVTELLAIQRRGERVEPTESGQGRSPAGQRSWHDLVADHDLDDGGLDVAFDIRKSIYSKTFRVHGTGIQWKGHAIALPWKRSLPGEYTVVLTKRQLWGGSWLGAARVLPADRHRHSTTWNGLEPGNYSVEIVNTDPFGREVWGEGVITAL